MRKYAILIVQLLICLPIIAQSSEVATLIHDGNISTYYGYYAFVEAHNKAKDGDVITLSSGTFKSTTVSKGITVRGAGFIDDSITHSNSTILSEEVFFDVPDSLRVSFEGIMFSSNVHIKRLSNSQFIRCCFSRNLSGYQNGGKTVNTSLYHCFVYGLNYSDLYSNSMNFTASVVVMSSGSYFCHFNFTNCILIPSSNSSSGSYSTFRNSIFIGKQSNGYSFQTLDPYNYSGLAFNCVSLNSTDIFSEQINKTNITVSDISSIFMTYKGKGLPLNENFALTDSATSVFVGSDGTQVGIYGGTFPFKTIPSYPHVTLFDVADKTDSQGNLNIKLEVSSGE